jgi:Tfp pilus assembly protein PilO
MSKKAPVVPSSKMLRWWFPLLVATIVMVGTPLVVIPKISETIEAHKSLGKVEADLAAAEKKLSQLESVDEAEVLQLGRELRTALPAQKPYYEMLLLLQQLGAKTGVALGDFELNPGAIATESAELPKTSKEGYVSLETELSVSGTTEQVSEFITNVQSSLPLLLVREITISGDKQDATEDIRQVSLNLDILYMADVPQTSTVTLTPLPPLSSSVDEVTRAIAGYYDPQKEYTGEIMPLTETIREDIFNF